RDIGSPPDYLFELADAVRAEMTDPASRRLFKLRRCQMALLSGRSGTGKTLSVYALWRLLYETMAEVTGVPLEELPPRVVRVRAAQILSMWFGESERNMDRCFQEILQLADTPVAGAGGKEHAAPVLVIIEEIDGLGRARGQEAVYDRVMTTLLQLLDPTRQELKDRLIVFVATTNVESLVDTALLRRIGATVERFGSLDRRAFAAVLAKHLAGIPIVSHNGTTQAEAERRLVQALTSWLFSPNGEDQGQVELSFANAPAPMVRRRRDFLTGGLVDRAVQQAANEASRAARRGREPIAGDGRPVGLTAELLMTSFDEQIQNIADRLDIYNAASYLDLPDGQRLTAIRRVARPAGPLPVSLMRTPAGGRPHQTSAAG
ncbi:MAG: AAA family ATPase, partial [Planctomycetes bacterium]|nr:AAA family ATPase [Planctomycetota bacterium]